MKPAKPPRDWWKLNLRLTLLASFFLSTYLLAYGPLSYYGTNAIITDDEYRFHNAVARAYRPVLDFVPGTIFEKPFFAYRQWWISKSMTDSHLTYCKFLPLHETGPHGEMLETIGPSSFETIR
jgi:hypothetical protein